MIAASSAGVIWNLGSTRCIIECELRLLRCPDCRVVRPEPVPWARPGAHHPRDFEDVVAWLAQQMAKTPICALLRVGWDTVGRIVEKGIWAQDVSSSGLRLGDQAQLEADGVVFPKLFRRMIEYLGEHPADPAGFLGWLADKREQVLDTTTNNFTHFDNVVAMSASKVRLLRLPEQLVFVSAKTSSRSSAPWLAI